MPDPCPGFDWLYARAGRCTYCRQPPWAHDHMIALTHEGLTPAPWPAPVVNGWVSQGAIPVSRAQQLRAPATGSNP